MDEETEPRMCHVCGEHEADPYPVNPPTCWRCAYL